MVMDPLANIRQHALDVHLIHVCAAGAQRAMGAWGLSIFVFVCALASWSDLVSAEGAQRAHRRNMETGVQHVTITADLTSQTASANQPAPTATADSAISSPRIVICSLLKNEVPYVVEWVEFHRFQGASKIVIYDDFSTDNVSLLNSLYHQHGRDYLVIEPGIWNEDGRARRGLAGEACFEKYRAESDWLINLDVDEFVSSPVYNSLPEFFLHEVPDSIRIPTPPPPPPPPPPVSSGDHNLRMLP